MLYSVVKLLNMILRLNPKMSREFNPKMQITKFNLFLVQLVLHCIPSIKRHFEVKLVQLNQSNDEKLPNKNLGVLRHFDHVTKDFQVF